MEGGIPQWLVIILGGVVPMMSFVGFWMSLSSRLTKAETAGENAIKAFDMINIKYNNLFNDFSLYREQVAKEYTNKDTIREVEDRLTIAINRLGDRFDKIITRIEK